MRNRLSQQTYAKWLEIQYDQCYLYHQHIVYCQLDLIYPIIYPTVLQFSNYDLHMTSIQQTGCQQKKQTFYLYFPIWQNSV